MLFLLLWLQFVHMGVRRGGVGATCAGVLVALGELRWMSAMANEIAWGLLVVVLRFQRSHRFGCPV